MNSNANFSKSPNLHPLLKPRLGSTLIAVCLLANCGGKSSAVDQDSAFVPPGYQRTFTADFDDPQEIFNAVDNPRFTTGNFRLNGEGDLNTTRRLGDNREQQLYLDRDFEYAGQKPKIDPFSIEGGVLTITADRLSPENIALFKPLAGKKIPGPDYSSGMLSTETEGRSGKGFVQLLGYWEMRARLPKGKGLWPAFWLVAETHDYWDEVDIVEVLGHEPNVIYHTTHFHQGGGTDGLSWKKRTHRKIDTSDGFHTYGLEITEKELVYSVDGKATLRVGHSLKHPLYTIINLAVGGKWPGNPDASTVFPAKMEIDYLRIYQKK